MSEKANVCILALSTLLGVQVYAYAATLRGGADIAKYCNGLFGPGLANFYCQDSECWQLHRGDKDPDAGHTACLNNATAENQKDLVAAVDEDLASNIS